MHIKFNDSMKTVVPFDKEIIAVRKGERLPCKLYISLKNNPNELTLTYKDKAAAKRDYNMIIERVY